MSTAPTSGSNSGSSVSSTASSRIASAAAGNVTGPSTPVTVALSVGPPLLTETVQVTPWLVRPGETVTLQAQTRGPGHESGAPAAWVSATLPTSPDAIVLGLDAQDAAPTQTWQTTWTVAEIGDGIWPVPFEAQDTAHPPLTGQATAPLWVDRMAPEAPTIIAPADPRYTPAAYTAQAEVWLAGEAEPGGQHDPPDRARAA